MNEEHNISDGRWLASPDELCQQCAWHTPHTGTGRFLHPIPVCSLQSLASIRPIDLLSGSSGVTALRGPCLLTLRAIFERHRLSSAGPRRAALKLHIPSVQESKVVWPFLGSWEVTWLPAANSYGVVAWVPLQREASLLSHQACFARLPLLSWPEIVPRAFQSGFCSSLFTQALRNSRQKRRVQTV